MGTHNVSKYSTPTSTPGTQKGGRKSFFSSNGNSNGSGINGNGIHTSISDGGLYQTSLFPSSMSHNHLSSLPSSSSSSNINGGGGGGGFQSRASSDALQLLAERGQENSSLVSLGLPKELNSHWLVKTSKRNMSFVGHVARSIAVSDSVLTGTKCYSTLSYTITIVKCRKYPLIHHLNSNER